MSGCNDGRYSVGVALIHHAADDFRSHCGLLYIFLHKFLEKIENYLCDIEMLSVNKKFCGDSFLGRKMRENFVTLVAVAPEIFWRQERIPRQKLLKLPPRLLWGVRIIYGSMILIGVSSGLLYYFRAPH